MQLPGLPPDIQFDVLSDDDEALRFSFDAKRAALGPYIVDRWGWDEAYQLQTHKARFAEKPFFKIVHNQCAIGTVSVMTSGDYGRFGEFHLFPAYQRKGIGTRVLQHCLSLTDQKGLPVRLEYLK